MTINTFTPKKEGEERKGKREVREHKVILTEWRRYGKNRKAKRDEFENAKGAHMEEKKQMKEGGRINVKNVLIS